MKNFSYKHILLLNCLLYPTATEARLFTSFSAGYCFVMPGNEDSLKDLFGLGMPIDANIGFKSDNFHASLMAHGAIIFSKRFAKDLRNQRRYTDYEFQVGIKLGTMVLYEMFGLSVGGLIGHSTFHENIINTASFFFSIDCGFLQTPYMKIHSFFKFDFPFQDMRDGVGFHAMVILSYRTL